MKLNVASLTSAKNIQIFAATGGKELSSELPLLVFLHGAGMDHTVWSLQTRYFAHHGYSVLSIDFPGHGRSDGTLLQSIEQMADWIPKLIDAALEISGKDGVSGSNSKQECSLAIWCGHAWDTRSHYHGD